MSLNSGWAQPSICRIAHLNAVSRSSHDLDVDEDLHCVTQSLLPGHPQEKCDLLEEEETALLSMRLIFILRTL